VAPSDIETLQAEVRDRFGPLPPPAQALFGSALLRVLGAALGVDGVLVRASEARVSFRADAIPRLKGLSVAFHDVQFQVDVRRTQRSPRDPDCAKCSGTVPCVPSP
jgi:transcription-repair coupling factor (superfamily II helicase)